MKSHRFGIAVVATVALAGVSVFAATTIVEPDDYLSIVPGGPGAILAAVRPNAAGNGFTYQRVLSVTGGAWTPTGSKVFGHSVLEPGELAYHWDNLSGAYACLQAGACSDFKVLGAYFEEPASTVKIRTTMRGEQAMDPVELWAFDGGGQRIQQCRMPGIDQGILNSGVLPLPTYVSGGAGPCGVLLEQKNCSGSQPGNCDWVLEMRVQRRVGDIGFVWFGGRLFDSTHANADALTYTVY